MSNAPQNKRVLGKGLGAAEQRHNRLPALAAPFAAHPLVAEVRQTGMILAMARAAGAAAGAAITLRSCAPAAPSPL